MTETKHKIELKPSTRFRKIVTGGSLATFLTIALFAAANADAKPLKVFILAGQSNMEGPASIETFDYIGDDPITAPMLREMVGPDGKPVVCDHAWISYLTGADGQNFELLNFA